MEKPWKATRWLKQCNGMIQMKSSKHFNTLSHAAKWINGGKFGAGKPITTFVCGRIYQDGIEGWIFELGEYGWASALYCYCELARQWTSKGW